MGEKSQLARQFIEAIPHAQELGMVLTNIGDGVAEISMPYDVKLIGDPDTGVIHGGAVSALMDTCCGAAVIVPSGPTAMPLGFRKPSATAVMVAPSFETRITPVMA